MGYSDVAFLEPRGITMTRRSARLAAAFALTISALCCGTAQAQSSPAVQTTFVPASAQFAAVAFPQRVLTSREMELYPIEVFSAASIKEAGFDVLNLEQVTFSGQATEGEPFQGGAVLRFNQPIDKTRAIAGLAKLGGEEGELTKAQHAKQEYFKPAGGTFAVAAPSDRVLVIGSEAWLKQMLDAAQPPAGKPSRIAGLLSQVDGKADFAAVVDMAALAGAISKELDKEKAPPEFEKFKRIPTLIGSLSGAASVRTGLKDRLVIQAKDEAAAKELDVLIPEALEVARKQMVAEVGKNPGNTAVEKALVRYFERISTELTAALRPTRRGLELSLEKDSGAGMTEIAILNALLLPAVQRVRETAREVQAANEAKQQ
jgi:hypothetical protein